MADLRRACDFLVAFRLTRKCVRNLPRLVPKMTRRRNRQSGSAFSALDKRMLNNRLLQRGQCVDSAVARLRVRARLEEVIGGLLDECPQLRRISLSESSHVVRSPRFLFCSWSASWRRESEGEITARIGCGKPEKREFTNEITQDRPEFDLCSQAIRVSYDLVRGARGQINIMALRKTSPRGWSLGHRR